MKFLDHTPKTVNLVCMGPSVVDYLTATLTQEFDHKANDETWVINMACNSFRCDVIFWMDDLIQQRDFRPKLIDALKDYNIPVITSTARPELVPLSYDFPIDPVAQIGCEIFGKPYLNNGVAMAVAYALYKGVKKLTIYGADFSYPNRDFAESGRACVEAWITIAGMKGMEIQLCPGTSLMDTVKDHGIYGYSEQPQITLKDGRSYRYFCATEAGSRGKYIPEDTAGEKAYANREELAFKSGTGGEPNAADATGGNDHVVEAERAAPIAVDQSGGSVRHPGGLIGLEVGTLALHDSGGKSGQVPREAVQHVLHASSDGRPGSPPVGA
jgi:hypothetical protein